MLAAQLLAAADLWLFVTTAARYADQVPWDFLKQAADRSAAVAIVLDRTPDGAVAEVSSHLAPDADRPGVARLAALSRCGRGRSTGDGLLPRSDVAEIKDWLAALAADTEARSRVVRQTLEGAIRSVAQKSHLIADAATEQVAMQARLRRDADQAYSEAISAVDRASADGTLLRGEVLARWQEFVGTGELLKGLETKVSWLRDRMGNVLRGKPQQAGQVTVAVESGLHTLILEHAEDAAEKSAASWGALDAGRALLESAGSDLGRASRDFRARSERTVREWQQAVLDMVRTEGADKRSTARFLAYGVNGLSVALMVVVFASTAGLTGAEVGIAGGSAVVGQKLLEAVFGDQAVRRLAHDARVDLNQRVSALLEEENRRFLAILDALEISGESPQELRDVSRRVDDLRFAQRSLSDSVAGQHKSADGLLRRAAPERDGGDHVSALMAGAKRLLGRRSDLGDQIGGLEQAVDSARGRIDDAVVDPVAAVVERSGARLKLSPEHTVVAIAGATGSGKSSTFKRAGRSRPRRDRRTPSHHVVGHRLHLGRPGRCGGPAGVGWVSRCATRPPATPCSTRPRRPATLKGLVLLDLPDHDSTEVSHHLEMERLIVCSDLMIWVLDPQKYADAAIHQRFLQPLAAHRDVMLVVLNHIDEVPRDKRQGMVEDVKRLLALDGLEGVPVFTTSAKLGDGIPELTKEIAKRVKDKKAARGSLPHRREGRRPEARVGLRHGAARASCPRPRATSSPTPSPTPPACRWWSRPWPARAGCAPRGPPAGPPSNGSPGSGPTRSSACTSTSTPREPT